MLALPNPAVAHIYNIIAEGSVQGKAMSHKPGFFGDCESFATEIGLTRVNTMWNLVHVWRIC